MQYLLPSVIWLAEVFLCLLLAFGAFNLKFRRICFDIGVSELKYYRYSTLIGQVIKIDTVHSLRRKYLLTSLGLLLGLSAIMALPPLHGFWRLLLPPLLLDTLTPLTGIFPQSFVRYILGIQALLLALLHLPALLVYPEELEREHLLRMAAGGGPSWLGRIFTPQRRLLKKAMIEVFRLREPDGTDRDMLMLGFAGNRVASTLAETILKAKREIGEDEIERLYNMLGRLQKTGIGFREPEPGEIAEALSRRQAEDPRSGSFERMRATRLNRKLLRIINALGVPHVLDVLGYSWRGRNQLVDALVHLRKGDEEFITRLIDVRKSDERGWHIDSLKMVREEVNVREGEEIEILSIGDQDLRQYGLRMTVMRVGVEIVESEGGMRRRFFAGQVESVGAKPLQALSKSVGL